ncbi:MAG: restriction endonuclease [Deltaproteobacteria bacterium]|nr:restriction endonuclease [Deltaproteobacteria bacterium]
MTDHTPATVTGLTNQLMGLTIGRVDITLPFGREIFLIKTRVAGTGYYQADEARPRLGPNQTLVLKRQPDNPHDELAIEIFTTDGQKLGYVPKKDNPVIARLMDAGKIISATLSWMDETAQDVWVDMNVDIVLKDI